MIPSSSSIINLLEPIGLFNSLTLESTKKANISVLVLNIVLVFVYFIVYYFNRKRKTSLRNYMINKVDTGLYILLIILVVFNLVWAIANSALLSSYYTDYVMINQAEQDPHSKNLCTANVVISWVIFVFGFLLFLGNN